MNFIKDAKELKFVQKTTTVPDEKVEESIAREIQENNQKGVYNVYIIKTKGYNDQPLGHQFDYVKKHKKDFREKGYKIHFNLCSILTWPEVSYTIKWKGNKQ